MVVLAPAARVRSRPGSPRTSTRTPTSSTKPALRDRTAVDALYGGASAALRETLVLELTFAAAAILVPAAAALPAAEADAWIISYTLEGDGPPLEIVQTVPAALASLLAVPAEPASDEPVVAAPSTAGETARLAVERASAITADAAADVLSTLFSEELSAATPTVDRAARPIRSTGSTTR